MDICPGDFWRVSVFSFISFTILSIAYAIQFLFIHAVVRSLFCDVDIMRMALF